MVFYRKYRPQTIDELDNTKVRETLTAILTNSEPHAFLFTGPKGLGKTSSARIVAKVVNCLHEKQAGAKGKKKIGIEPCNTCEQCQSITRGTNLDVLEMDAASNRGIDEIRDLKEKIRLAPVSAKKKVYIIDEVHMLTTEAFNALLKTLEEPPGHALFVLCTTEPHKVPATILSRCFHVAFCPATPEELVRSFQRVVTGEKIAVDDDALLEIATLAEGGFRDGIKILEELTALASGTLITKSFIDERYKSQSVKQHIVVLLILLAQKNAKESLQLVTGLMKQGIDIKYFLTILTETLHNLLLARVGVKQPETQLPEIALELADIQSLITLFAKALTDTKYAVLPQLPLELAILDWTQNNSERRIQNSKREEDKAQQGLPEAGGEKTSSVTQKGEVSVASLRRHVGNLAKIKALYGESATADGEEKLVTVTVNSVNLLQYSAEGELSEEWMDNFWRCIISEMKQHNHTIAGVLRGCILKSFDRKNLIIQTAYKFHKERLDNRKTREVLEAICRQLIGKPIAISIVLKSSN